MQQKTYKYRINERLLKLPVSDYRKALKVIPMELGISDKTFANYRNIEMEDKQDIPHEMVDKLEKLFSLQPGELQNYTSETRPIAEHGENLNELAQTIGLHKS